MFTYHGDRLDYFDHPYNDTIRNERSVEIAAALHWLPGKGTGLEVGNVLGHYGVTGHRVVDLHEQADGVENVDVFDIAGRYDWIVSISTIEHVGRDERPRRDALAISALGHLCGLLNPGGTMLVSIPGGYNPTLDGFLEHGAGTKRAATFERHGDGWRQTERPTFKPYGASTPWAETVWVGEW